MRIRAAAVLFVMLPVVARSTVHATPGPTPADDAFERGRALMAAGNISEACAAFDDSLRLDFQYGTLFNLAQCDERRGKLATAYAEFRRIARDDVNNPARAGRARELADALEPRVPRLHVAITGPSTRDITLDGAPLDVTEPAPIDLGSHELVVAGVHRTVAATHPGERIELAINLAPTVPAATPLAPIAPITTTSESTRARHHAPAIVTVGGGVAIASAGLILGAIAWKRWGEAQDLAATDAMAANREVAEVHTLGNSSTVLVAVGAVAIAVGIYLWRR